jgi:hypothetical protein
MRCERLAGVGSGVGCDAVAGVSGRQLQLHINKLSGSIPSTLGSLTALR